MLAGLAIAVCLVAGGVVVWIALALYAPQRRRAAPPRGRIVIEPMFATRRAPTAPRRRLARGTGEVVQDLALDVGDITEKVLVTRPRP